MNKRDRRKHGWKETLKRERLFITKGIYFVLFPMTEMSREQTPTQHQEIPLLQDDGTISTLMPPGD